MKWPIRSYSSYFLKKAYPKHLKYRVIHHSASRHFALFLSLYFIHNTDTELLETKSSPHSQWSTSTKYSVEFDSLRLTRESPRAIVIQVCRVILNASMNANCKLRLLCQVIWFCLPFVQFHLVLYTVYSRQHRAVITARCIGNPLSILGRQVTFEAGGATFKLISGRKPENILNVYLKIKRVLQSKPVARASSIRASQKQLYGFSARNEARL